MPHRCITQMGETALAQAPPLTGGPRLRGLWLVLRFLFNGRAPVHHTLLFGPRATVAVNIRLFIRHVRHPGYIDAVVNETLELRLGCQRTEPVATASGLVCSLAIWHFSAHQLPQSFWPKHVQRRESFARALDRPKPWHRKGFSKLRMHNDCGTLGSHDSVRQRETGGHERRLEPKADGSMTLAYRGAAVVLDIYTPIDSIGCNLMLFKTPEA